MPRRKKSEKLKEALIPAVLLLLGAVLGAILGYLGTMANAKAQIKAAEANAQGQITAVWIPIRASQTAESFSTFVAMTAQAQLLLNTPTPSSTPVPTKTPASLTALVYSRSYPFATTYIPVEKGDTIEISVTGENQTWNCGRADSIGPDGYPEKGYSDLVYLQARPCALIGLILSGSSEEYFLVGSYTTHEVKQSGLLYLGCNDSKGRFEDNPTDSVLEVRVSVRG